MKQLDPPHHPNPQWTKAPIEVRLCLSEKSLKPQDRFYSRISKPGGYSIGSPCFFSATSRDSSNSFRVEVVSGSLEHEKKSLSFHVVSSLREVSLACSKLNMSSAFHSEVTARLENRDVVFSITVPNAETKENLLRNLEVIENGFQTH